VVGEFLNAYGQAAKAIGPTVGAVTKVARKPAVLAPVSQAGRVRRPLSDFEE